jgi:hypothetical protein
MYQKGQECAASIYLSRGIYIYPSIHLYLLLSYITYPFCAFSITDLLGDPFHSPLTKLQRRLFVHVGQKQ